jgi:monovalent cation:H+ antiporter-2, CPA2 family
VAAFLIVLAFGRPTITALTISASLAQIGEFSFVLAELGVKLGVLPDQGRDLILAGALLSICLNPLVFFGVALLTQHLERRRALTAPMQEPTTPAEPSVTERAADAPLTRTALSGHTVLVGYGRVGTPVGQFLKAQGWPFVVMEESETTVRALREAGIEAILGNAADSDVLKGANLAEATNLIVAIPEAFEAGQVVQQGRAANPSLEIIARAFGCRGRASEPPWRRLRDHGRAPDRPKHGRRDNASIRTDARASRPVASRPDPRTHVLIEAPSDRLIVSGAGPRLSGARA